MTVGSFLLEALFGRKSKGSTREVALAGAITSGFFEVSRAMNTTVGSRQESLDLIVSAATSILRMERCVLLLKVPGEEMLALRAAAGIPRGKQFQKYSREVHAAIFDRILSSGEAMLVSEGRADRNLLRLMHRLDVKGFLAAPIQGPAGPVGILAAATPLDGRDLSEGDLKLVSVMANFAGVTLQNADLVAKLERKARKLTAIFEVSRVLNEERDPNVLFQLVTDRAVELMGASSGSVILVDRESGLLRIEAERGLGPEVKEKILLRIGEGITGWVAKEGKAVLVPDVASDPRYVEANPEVRSEMAAPIRWGDKTVGVLNLDHHEREAFAPEDLELLTTFANTAAVALRNARALGLGEGEKPA